MKILVSSAVPPILEYMAAQYRATATPVVVTAKPFKLAKPKACFDNAYKWCSRNPGSVYVVGYLMHTGIPIEHAWVRQGRAYFDVTIQVAHPSAKYFSLFELDSQALAHIVVKTEAPPGLYECLKYGKQTD